MDEPGPGAYMPFTSFRFYPRWFDPNPHRLPEAAWPSVNALKPEAARAVYRVRERLRPRVSNDKARIAVASDIKAVRAWLLDRGVPADERVAVAWDAVTALLTRWGTFQMYWNAFWYHSHLDIAVFSMDERFVLSNDERDFVFARLEPGS